MKAIIIHPRFNTANKSDATGAFIPAAKAFAKLHGVHAENVFGFDNTKPLSARYREVCKFLREVADRIGKPDTIAYFGHGWRDGLQCGVTMSRCEEFASFLGLACGNDCKRVLLYACDAGRDADDHKEDDLLPGPGGTGGFADELRAEFFKRCDPVTVYAHATAGHTTTNPWVRVFDAGFNGGEFVIGPKDRLWPSWRAALRETDLWARFPFMSHQELEKELVGTSHVG